LAVAPPLSTSVIDEELLIFGLALVVGALLSGLVRRSFLSLAAVFGLTDTPAANWIGRRAERAA
jgi:hypothetical protein